MDVHVAVAPETLWTVTLPVLGDLHITNSFVTMLLVMAFLLIVGTLVAHSATLVPGRIQSIFEFILEFILGLVEGTAGKRAGRRIFPLLSGLFIFILVSNYSGLLPGVGTIYLSHEEEEHASVQHEVASVQVSDADHEVTVAQAQGDVEEEVHHADIPLFRAPSADLNMTLAMALVTFTVVQVAGISAHGVIGRIKHMANPPFLFPIEVVGEFSRIVSLSFRLFGNVFAGEVLLAVMVTIANAIKISVVGLLIPVVFLYLEVLFGFIQALVFTLLTLIYIVLATAGHHEEEHVGEIREAEEKPLGQAVSANAGH